MHTRLKSILEKETKRQSENINLIASENYSSKAVREAVGSIFMHKYSEGNIGSRFYEGNQFIDELEDLAISATKKVFSVPDTWGVNVQALAGSNANLIVYNSILEPGDKIMSMYLPDGGHLSHGWSIGEDENRDSDQRVYRGGNKKVSIVSKFYNVVQYKTDPETNLLDYDFIRDLAIQEKPKLIITGGTAYTRNIDYTKISNIAKEVGAYYLADVAHEAGLIGAGVLPSPIGIADFVTFTTHKTLRGPKGAVIVSSVEQIKKINKSVMPGIQGGPHNGTIAGIAQAMLEADTPEFVQYAKNIVENAKCFEMELKNRNFSLVSGGTDKHLLLVDLRNKGIGGKFFSRALSLANIITNMNTIPYETGTPLNPSGIRIGTPSISSRGMGPEEVREISDLIQEVLEICLDIQESDFSRFNDILKNSNLIKEVNQKALELTNRFPIDL